MNCRDFHEIIDSYLSDELLTETNHDVLRHLEVCPDCRGEIEYRRFVRARLKSAVLSAPEFEMSGRFSAHVSSVLRNSLALDRGEKDNSRTWAWNLSAVAAGILLMFTVGFYYFSSNGVNEGRESYASYSVPNLPAGHIVNIAAGDHEFCAIRHSLSEAPVSLEAASVKFMGLDGVVANGLRSALANYEMIESHACKYKDVRFAHMILRNNGQRLSVMVTDELGSDLLEREGVLRFATQKYRIARFDLDRRAVFVVSELDANANTIVAEALYEPLSTHFSDSELRKNVKTALLMFY